MFRTPDGSAGIADMPKLSGPSMPDVFRESDSKLRVFLLIACFQLEDELVRLVHWANKFGN
jgi:hypothetical protein